MTPILETLRLVLHPLALADAEQVQPLFANWEIVQYLNNRVPWPYPSDGALKFYRDIALPAIERGEAWHWTLRLKTAPNEIIGAIGLARDGDNRGFWLGRAWQGQGLMMEACTPVTDFWFDTLHFPVLRVTKAIPNVASQRISEKQGMRLVGVEERDYVCGRLPAQIWEITADEWQANRAELGI
jgi:[ribosomal protein S5]-alanine N-acetyltransferase